MEKITLKLFWICMLACATSFLVSIWFKDSVPVEFFKTTATLFVIGFANFLIWAPLMAYRFLNKMS